MTAARDLVPVPLVDGGWPISNVPLTAPGQCFVCGATESNAGPYVKLPGEGWNVDADYWLCSRCLRHAAASAGMRLATSEHLPNEVERRYNHMIVQVDQWRRRTQSLVGILQYLVRNELLVRPLGGEDWLLCPRCTYRARGIGQYLRHYARRHPGLDPDEPADIERYLTMMADPDWIMPKRHTDLAKRPGGALAEQFTESMPEDESEPDDDDAVPFTVVDATEPEGSTP